MGFKEDVPGSSPNWWPYGLIIPYYNSPMNDNNGNPIHANGNDSENGYVIKYQVYPQRPNNDGIWAHKMQESKSQRNHFPLSPLITNINVFNETKNSYYLSSYTRKSETEFNFIILSWAFQTEYTITSFDWPGNYNYVFYVSEDISFNNLEVFHKSILNDYDITIYGDSYLTHQLSVTNLNKNMWVKLSQGDSFISFKNTYHLCDQVINNRYKTRGSYNYITVDFTNMNNNPFNPLLFDDFIIDDPYLFQNKYQIMGTIVRLTNVNNYGDLILSQELISINNINCYVIYSSYNPGSNLNIYPYYTSHTNDKFRHIGPYFIIEEQYFSISGKHIDSGWESFNDNSDYDNISIIKYLDNSKSSIDFEIIFLNNELYEDTIMIINNEFIGTYPYTNSNKLLYSNGDINITSSIDTSRNFKLSPSKIDKFINLDYDAISSWRGIRFETEFKKGIVFDNNSEIIISNNDDNIIDNIDNIDNDICNNFYSISFFKYYNSDTSYNTINFSDLEKNFIYIYDINFPILYEFIYNYLFNNQYLYSRPGSHIENDQLIIRDIRDDFYIKTEISNNIIITKFYSKNIINDYIGNPFILQNEYIGEIFYNKYYYDIHDISYNMDIIYTKYNDFSIRNYEYLENVTPNQNTYLEYENLDLDNFKARILNSHEVNTMSSNINYNLSIMPNIVVNNNPDDFTDFNIDEIIDFNIDEIIDFD